jgi:hypothetical protein
MFIAQAPAGNLMLLQEQHNVAPEGALKIILTTML